MQLWRIHETFYDERAILTSTKPNLVGENAISLKYRVIKMSLHLMITLKTLP
jgi:hypothetical protein